MNLGNFLEIRQNLSYLRLYLYCLRHNACTKINLKAIKWQQ